MAEHEHELVGDGAVGLVLHGVRAVHRLGFVGIRCQRSNGRRESERLQMSATQAAVEPLNSTLYRPRLKAVAPITKTRAFLRKLGCSCDETERKVW